MPYIQRKNTTWRSQKRRQRYRNGYSAANSIFRRNSFVCAQLSEGFHEYLGIAMSLDRRIDTCMDACFEAVFALGGFDAEPWDDFKQLDPWCKNCTLEKGSFSCPKVCPAFVHGDKSPETGYVPYWLKP